MGGGGEQMVLIALKHLQLCATRRLVLKRIRTKQQQQQNDSAIEYFESNGLQCFAKGKREIKELT